LIRSPTAVAVSSTSTIIASVKRVDSLMSGANLFESMCGALEAPADQAESTAPGHSSKSCTRYSAAAVTIDNNIDVGRVHAS